MSFPVVFRLTAANRNSVAAVLAVLEREVEPGLVEPVLVRSAQEFDGRGLLACSFTTGAREETGRELAHWRERFGPQLRSVAGGPHPSADPHGALADGFTWVVPGEAGRAFASLVRGLAKGEEPAPGVVAGDVAQPLDAYPCWPQSGQLFAQIEITRGCPMHCGFCQTPRLFGRGVRHRSLEALRRHFEHAVATGHRYTRFTSPNAFAYGSLDGYRPAPHAVESLLRLAREHFRSVYFGTFPSEVRPEWVSDEMLALVRDHCDNRTIAVGLQSGSDEVLRRAKRGHTAARGIEAVARISRAGFQPKVDFIFGLPGETSAEQARTRDVIRHITAEFGAVVHAHLFTPLPGTPFAAAARAPIDAETRDLVESLAGATRATGIEAGRLEGRRGSA